MGLLSEVMQKYREDGAVSVAYSSVPYVWRQLQINNLIDLPSKLRITNTYDIYSHEWDLLIVLDACRYDLMASISSEYEFLSDISYKYSPASSSSEWMEAQFSQSNTKQMTQTTYITGNTFSNKVLSSAQFALLDEVWKYGWDEERGTIPPRIVTDRAITVSRNQDPDKLIVHYMQPHFPALNDPQLGGEIDPIRSRWINSVWEKLSTGALSYETVWHAYKSNLHEVLSEVELLLTNSSFERVIITADHGNGFGKSGIYGHPGERTHECLRKVPWVRTHAVDTNEHVPKTHDTDSNTESIQSKLAALGYV